MRTNTKRVGIFTAAGLGAVALAAGAALPAQADDVVTNDESSTTTEATGSLDALQTSIRDALDLGLTGGDILEGGLVNVGDIGGGAILSGNDTPIGSGNDVSVDAPVASGNEVGNGNEVSPEVGNGSGNGNGNGNASGNDTSVGDVGAEVGDIAGDVSSEVGDVTGDIGADVDDAVGDISSDVDDLVDGILDN